MSRLLRELDATPPAAWAGDHWSLPDGTSVEPWGAAGDGPYRPYRDRCAACGLAGVGPDHVDPRTGTYSCEPL